MKSLKFLLIPALLFGMAASDPAWADRGHHHGGHFHGHARFGVFVGAPLVAAPLFYPWYSSPYPYYAPPPAVYVEQGDPAGYWYHCSNPPGYYPYVKECPAGWNRVAPTSPPY